MKKLLPAFAVAVLLTLPFSTFAQDRDLGQDQVGTQEEQIFSGPQPGEPLPGFEFRVVVPGPTDIKAGENMDVVTAAEGGPVAMIFLHEFTRPSIGLTRTVMTYAGTLAEKGLKGATVYLHDDPTAAEAQINRAARAMSQSYPLGISNDGKEGPGAYGLNRNVAMTVLIAKENKVLANFALVQPSVQADALKIAIEIAKAVGVDPPTEDQLRAAVPRPQMDRRNAADGARMQAAQDPALRGYLTPIIAQDATSEEVDAAVARLEAYVKDKPAVKKQVGDIARRIIAADRLETYGTAAAQAYLKKWAEEWGVDGGDDDGGGGN